MSRILVTGSRHYKDVSRIFAALDDHVADGDTVVHGGARGADSIAAEYCRRYNIEQEVHEPDWDAYGRAAGPIRNAEMLSSGIDKVLAFLDDTACRGTFGTIREAKKRSIETVVVRFREWERN